MVGIDFIFAIAVLIMSVVVHEVSHGYSAYLLGDPTAKYAGRLTMNPLKHLDFIGSLVVPVMTYLLSGFLFGWAKPVPYNPYNLKNQKWGPAVVGVSGPLANFLVALSFGFLLRFGASYSFLPSASLEILSLIVFINLLLGIFNLVPVPPLDGSKLLFALLPYSWQNVQYFFERFGIFLLLFFVFFLWQFVSPFISVLFSLITGINF